MIIQETVTLLVHAEIKNDDTYVMAGKRCLEQRNHANVDAARRYLSEHWGLTPKTKTKTKTPEQLVLVQQEHGGDNCQCETCVAGRKKAARKKK